jgi:hypothetical protein
VPGWAKWALGVLAALVLLYLLGFVIFGCGTETGAAVGS